MQGQVIGGNNGGGLQSFYGDGSDGVLDLSATPAQQITAPNGGIVANLKDGNLGTFFVTNAISTGAVIYNIDFGQDVSLNTLIFKSASVSVGSALVNIQYSNDGITWPFGNLTSVNLTTTVADATFTMSSNFVLARYWRLVIGTATGVTISIAESQVTFATSGTLMIPVVGHSGLIIKNYTNINIPVGFTVTSMTVCRGMILYCTGNVTNVGTITMTSRAGFGTDNIAPMIIGKLKSDLTTKELTKYFQLTTVLEALKGGAGGNGGKGGNGAGVGGNGGTGGLGRINAGGYGGGGGGGGGNAGAAAVGGKGGAIPYAELGGGLGGGSASYPGNPSFVGIDGSNGGGGSGGHNGLTTGYYSGAGGNATSCGAGAGGGGGASSANQGQSGNPASGFAGGLILIICKGSFNNSGTISSNGASGGTGGAEVAGTGGAGGAGGGGAGGGVVAIFYGGSYTNTGSITVAAGAGGTAGGFGTGTGTTASVAGSSGSTGTIVTQKIA